MSRHSSIHSSRSNSSLQGNDCQRAPPQPDPEPAAPPIIILAQNGNKPTVQPRTQIQAQAPAEQEQGLWHPTSSLPLQRQTPRYNLRNRSSKQPFSRPPNKPRPQPEPHPAPPVIILSDQQLQLQQQEQHLLPPPPPSPSSHPAAPLPQAPTPRNPRTRTPSRNAMGSKVSKVRERAQDGKLQPSQEQLDKAQMKEPSNYYSHRSKSMRRKAGKGGEAAGGTSGSAGGL